MNLPTWSDFVHWILLYIGQLPLNLSSLGLCWMKGKFLEFLSLFWFMAATGIIDFVFVVTSKVSSESSYSLLFCYFFVFFPGALVSWWHWACAVNLIWVEKNHAITDFERVYFDYGCLLGCHVGIGEKLILNADCIIQFFLWRHLSCSVHFVSFVFSKEKILFFYKANPFKTKPTFGPPPPKKNQSCFWNNQAPSFGKSAHQQPWTENHR